MKKTLDELIGIITFILYVFGDVAAVVLTLVVLLGIPVAVVTLIFTTY